jgi:hypothetical protein
MAAFWPMLRLHFPAHFKGGRRSTGRQAQFKIAAIFAAIFGISDSNSGGKKIPPFLAFRTAILVPTFLLQASF